MAISGLVSLEALSETDCFSLLLQTAVKQNFAVAFWRLPNDTRKHFIISKKQSFLRYTDTLEDLAPGFIFAPFEPAADRIFLGADFSFTFSNGKLNSPESELETTSHVWLYEVIQTNRESENWTVYTTGSTALVTRNKDFFLNLVNDALAQIEGGSFEKVVVSRTKVIDLDSTFNAAEAFDQLCSLRSNALISFVSIQKAHKLH